MKGIKAVYNDEHAVLSGVQCVINRGVSGMNSEHAVLSGVQAVLIVAEAE
jgi:RsiW-degrading membrane proteinase PrsW (M82 family)